MIAHPTGQLVDLTTPHTFIHLEVTAHKKYWGQRDVEVQQVNGRLYVGALEVKLLEPRKTAHPNVILAKASRHPLANANLLDFLLKNPEFIPRSWNQVESILFAGTIYTQADREYIRSMRRDRIVGWTNEGFPPLIDKDREWFPKFPIAIFK